MTSSPQNSDRRGLTDTRALDEARAALARDPDSPGPLFRLCCLLLERGDPAVSELLPRLERFPRFAQGWTDLGETLLRLDQPGGAWVAFSRALQQSPPPSAAVLGGARALLAANRKDEAVDLLSASRRDWPREAHLHGERGRLLYAAGAWREAAAALERAVALDRHQAEAWFRLGLTRQDLQDHEGAAHAYRHALAARPAMYEAALNLGIALQDTGQLDAALDAYRRAVRLQPGCFNRVAQALVSASTGRLWLSIAALRRILLEDR